MGLDQYLLAQKNNKKVDTSLGIMNGQFPYAIKSDKEQIGYFRKNYALADYIICLLGLEDCDTNCVDYELNEDNIISIINHLNYLENNNPDKNWYGKGYFKDCTLQFKKALDFINNGYKVYYKEWF